MNTYRSTAVDKGNPEVLVQHTGYWPWVRETLYISHSLKPVPQSLFPVNENKLITRRRRIL